MTGCEEDSGGKREMDIPQSQTPSWSLLLIPSRAASRPLLISFAFFDRVYSTVVCEAFICGLSAGLHAACYIVVSPKARKVAKAVSTLRNFKIWKCIAAMGEQCSPILKWKAAGIAAESNWSFDQQKVFKAELHAVPVLQKCFMLHFCTTRVWSVCFSLIGAASMSHCVCICMFFCVCMFL